MNNPLNEIVNINPISKKTPLEDHTQSNALSQQLATRILCGACQGENPTRLCNRCKSIKYCNIDCQNKNGPSHQKICVEVK